MTLPDAILFLVWLIASAIAVKLFLVRQGLSRSAKVALILGRVTVLLIGMPLTFIVLLRIDTLLRLQSITRAIDERVPGPVTSIVADFSGGYYSLDCRTHSGNEYSSFVFVPALKEPFLEVFRVHDRRFTILELKPKT